MSSGLLPSFLGALQASVAVLLTISFGAVASRFNLLKESSSRDISKTCVRLFLPALLITNVGSELHADTAYRYVPVLSKLSIPKGRNEADRIDSMGSDLYTLLNGFGLGIEAYLQVSCLDCASYL
jgi:hypothetical protein